MQAPERIGTLPLSLAPLIAGMILGAASLVLGVVPAFAGPIGCNVFGGWYMDPDETLVGAGLRISLAPITFNPNAEYIFADNGSSYTVNLDGTMTVLPFGVGSAWLGAGLGFFTVDPDPGDSNTETGLNLIAGAGLNLPLSPYTQIKAVMIDGDDPFAVTFGVRF
jgi:hypothetical protein